jgi:hypothetical protein
MHADTIPCRAGGRSFLRSVALLLASSVAVLSGMLFMTQTTAYAFTKATPVKLLPSVAKQAVGITPWGRGILTALTIAQMAGVPMPWKQNPEVEPNSDQPAPSSAAGVWAPLYDYMIVDGLSVQDTVNAGKTTFTMQSHPAPGTASGSITVGSVGDGTNTTEYMIRARCTTSSAQSLSWYPQRYGEATTSVTLDYSCTSGGLLEMTLGTSSTTYATFRFEEPSPDGATQPDPLRRLTPYSRCTNGSTTEPVVGQVVGNIVNYRESETERPLIIPPACPESMPHREGFGADSQPLLPDGTPDPQYAPAPVIPPITRTDLIPAPYQECAGPAADCEVVKRRTARPGPVTHPDGTTTTNPEPDKDGWFCTYGPYNVPAAECADPDIPVRDEEDLTVQPEPSPDNCNLSDFSLNPVSWVVVPLKCLFIPRDESVQAAGAALSDAYADTAPAVVTTAIGDVFSPAVGLKDDAGQADCEGPAFEFPSIAGVTEPWTLRPLSTCNRLTEYLLGIYMPIATAMVYLGGFFAGTRIVLKTFNVESPVKEA